MRFALSLTSSPLPSGSSSSIEMWVLSPPLVSPQVWIAPSNDESSNDEYSHMYKVSQYVNISVLFHVLFDVSKYLVSCLDLQVRKEIA
jgi:hypothetical protein